MADYNISAKITADTNGFESGVKKAQTSSKKLSKSIASITKGFGKGGLAGAVSGAGIALGVVGIAIGVTVKAVQKLSKTINECTEAYKKQLNAERALDTAIKNSPIMTETASKRLKEFASQIQKTSNIGDEELLPMMAQLVATGRDEAEVMKIIQTATDMSATGTMSLDTAITQLNATLNGNIGRLGQQNSELKGLTEEELKNGKAVDILASKYKGMAENTIDTSKQLKNAIGDLKEAYGSTFENALIPVRKYFTAIIQGWADAKKARDEYDNAEKAKASGTATGSQLILYYEQQLKYIANERLELEGMYGADKEYAEARLKALELEENKYKSLIATEKYRLKQAEANAKAEAENQAKLDAEAEKEKTIGDLKDKYLKKLAEQESRWANIKSVTGEEVDLAEKIKFYEDELVNIMTEAGGQITTNNQYYKDQIAIIERLRKGLDPEQQKVSTEWESKLRDQVIANIEAEKETALEKLNIQKASQKEIEKLTVAYNEQLRGLTNQRLEEERQQALESVKDFANAQEERERINRYYDREILNNNIKYAEENKKAGEVASKSFAEGFKSVISKTSVIIKKLSNVLKSVGNIVKGLFSGGKSIFQKLFDLNTDTALDGLLQIEDKILTFFVETLPKLPQFVASVMQSISVMLQSVMAVITPEKIEEVITNIMAVIQEQAPAIIEAIGEILSNLLEGLIASAPQMFKTLNIIIDKLTEVLPSLIEKITEGIVSLMPSIMETLANIVEGIAEIIPQLIQSLIDVVIAILKNPDELARIVVAVIKGVVEIFNVILKNIGPLLEALLPAIGKIIIEIIKAIPDILASMAEALWEAVKGIGKFIVNMIIDILNTMFDGISKAWTWIPGAKGIPHIPKLATGTDNAQRGLAIVGEAGPELVNFRGGEQVLSNRNTQKALAGIGNGGNTFNVTFNNTQDTTAYAMMSQLRQYNRVMAINGVI